MVDGNPSRCVAQRSAVVGRSSCLEQDAQVGGLLLRTPIVLGQRERSGTVVDDVERVARFFASMHCVATSARRVEPRRKIGPMGLKWAPKRGYPRFGKRETQQQAVVAREIPEKPDRFLGTTTNEEEGGIRSKEVRVARIER